MPSRLSTVCAIALASGVASFASAGPASAHPCDSWVRAVQPRGGSALEIEIGGDPAEERDVTIVARDPQGAEIPIAFPPIPHGNGNGPLRLRGPVLNREYRGFSLEITVRNRRTGALVAASSTTIG